MLSYSNGPIVSRPRTSPFHGGNTSSNLVGITTKKALIMRAFLVVKSDEAERAEFETEQREGRRNEHSE